jgi:hypothetical protein
MFTFTFDHGVSDGAGGYGAVCVETAGDHWYIGRSFAPTVLVERFPEARLTYADSAAIVLWLAARPSFSRKVLRDGTAPERVLDCVER